MTPRTRDIRTGYGARLRAPGFLAPDAAPGGGLVIAGENKRMCICCADMRPTKGGRVAHGFFRCALHGKAVPCVS
jgi:hypothetical protein